MSSELMALPLEEALPVVRAFGHYLNLTSIAEMHHSARVGAGAAAIDGSQAHSADEIFLHLIERGVERGRLYEFVSAELHVEIVLTAHPTQVNRRTLQHKFTRIAQLLAEKDAPGLAEGRRGALLEDLRREVTALWQTDELRRRKPTPLDEARGGLHIVEQSLWSAVPEHLRRTSAALLRHTGRGLPIDAKPVRFSSWMGGDRDGNPNVTAKVTHDVACLARWMGADLYLKEVDALRFELSMTHASDELWRLARDVAARHAAEAEAAAAAGHGGVGPREGPAGGGGAPAPDAPDGAGAEEESLLVAGASFAMSPRALSAALAAGGGSGAALASAGGSPAGLSPVGSLAAQGSAMWTATLDRYAGPGSPRGAASARGSLDGRPPPSNGAGANGSVPASPRPARAAPRALTPDQLRRRGAQAARRGKTTIEALLHPRAAGAAPYRIVLGELRARLLATKRRMEDMLAGHLPDDEAEWCEHESSLLAPLLACYWSLVECGGEVIANGRLLDLIRRFYCFGLPLMKLDVRQESSRHAGALTEVTEYLGLGRYSEWGEDRRLAWLAEELGGRRPLVPPHMPFSPEAQEVLDTFKCV
jgi:phosphoenolpyruvate carboxylase